MQARKLNIKQIMTQQLISDNDKSCVNTSTVKMIPAEKSILSNAKILQMFGAAFRQGADALQFK